jgi:catechol 2,3-dioxygenase-like lactoylglutathione lyase family enzyme
MIDHLSTYATNFTTTKTFYEAVLPTLGYELHSEMTLDSDPALPGRRVCAFGPAGKPVLFIVEVADTASPRHIAFAAPNREAVALFHESGLTAGGQDLGAPGLRPVYHQHYYGSFLIDPDGNNVEAVCHAPSG